MSSLAGPFPFSLSLLLSQNRGSSGEEVGIACARHSAAELTAEVASTEEMRELERDDNEGEGVLRERS